MPSHSIQIGFVAVDPAVRAWINLVAVGIKVAFTDLRLVGADIDLAVLKLDQLVESESLPIRKDVASIGESFVVLGYPIPQVLEPSLTASRGIVSKLVTDNLQILHDESTDPGNSGGPCLDDRGNVIGVHFAASTVARNNRNFAISTTAINMFLSGLPEYTEVPVRTESLNFSEVIKANKDSVFMIECYDDQMPIQNQSQRSVEEPTTNVMQAYALIADKTCLTCFGKGHVDCPACVNGFVSVRKTVQIAFNNFTKQPIMGEKSFKSACRRCRRGDLACPACRGNGQMK